ncbi:MAG: hypothetical protein C4516_08020 [Oxalobacter sp.]|nr:MAG: hypothetical protein C4516_08020 [Oxalobacter sp.]
MLKKIINFMYALRDRQRITIGLTKGVAAMATRTVDLRDPGSWEFSGFSQNGEDGILQVLRSQLKRQNKYFIEIGAADGIDNNSAWLTIVEKYAGLMIEGDPALVERATRMVGHYSLGLEIRNMFVDKNSAPGIKSLSLYADPDVFSLDIDGNDYYVADALIKSGFRPKIFVVEFNSAFGPLEARTIKYSPTFRYTAAHPSELYYGVSITGWRNFFDSAGYRFVTVDRKGVNAFFAAPEYFDPGFLNSIVALEFAENELQMRKFRVTHAEQFKQIAHMPFHFIAGQE